MQDLRLIGVHEDGQHLLLADADGGRYRLTLDEALRAAARRDRPRLGQLQIEIEGGLRPRDVQALIRSGLSTEEVADRAGWTVEKVRRFEGPVLAEREHVARGAQQCAVGSRGTGPITLAERVGERLRDRGVDRDEVEWDSARDEEGVWPLTLTFPAGGRERTATWRYEPLGGSVTATDDEARWLSEEAAAGRHPDAAPAAPAATSTSTTSTPTEGWGAVHQRDPHEPIDLMAAMREHSTRGRRSAAARRRRAPPARTARAPTRCPIEDLALDVARPAPPAARGRNPVSAHRDEPSDATRRGRLAARGPRRARCATTRHPPRRPRRRAPANRDGRARAAQGSPERAQLGRHRVRHPRRRLRLTGPAVRVRTAVAEDLPVLRALFRRSSLSNADDARGPARPPRGARAARHRGAGRPHPGGRGRPTASRRLRDDRRHRPGRRLRTSRRL